jgi:hypothetical protein
LISGVVRSGLHGLDECHVNFKLAAIK